MSESSLVRRIKLAVRKHYPTAWVVKLADRHHRGLPDLLIQCRLCEGGYPGHGITLYVETKVKGGRLSKIQEAEHERIYRAGGCVAVATDVAQVLGRLRLLGAHP